MILTTGQRGAEHDPAPGRTGASRGPAAATSGGGYPASGSRVVGGSVVDSVKITR